MIHLQAPERMTEYFPTKSIFLAGSIEMGKAVNWQQQIVNKLKDSNVMIYNPRRDDWDSSWVQSIDNPQFNEQVSWELEHLEKADLVPVYIDPKTTSPITLLELGLHANSNKLVVCCPEGFYRKGNVDIVCERYNIKQVPNLQVLVDYVYFKVGGA